MPMPLTYYRICLEYLPSPRSQEVVLASAPVSIGRHLAPKQMGRDSNDESGRIRLCSPERILRECCVLCHREWEWKVGGWHHFVHCQSMSTKDSKAPTMSHIRPHYSRDRRVTVAPLKIYPEGQDGQLTAAEFHDTPPLRRVKRRVDHAKAPHCPHKPLSAPF